MVNQQYFNNLEKLRTLVKQLDALESVYCVDMDIANNTLDEEGNFKTGVFVKVQICLEDPDISFSLTENCMDNMLLNLQRHYDHILLMG